MAALGGIHLTLPGSAAAFTPVAVATSSIADALSDARRILVAVPASAHPRSPGRVHLSFETVKPSCSLPGRTGGALEFRRVLREAGCRARILLGEANTFPLAARSVGPAAAVIYGAKDEFRAAALPATRTSELLAAWRPLLPMLSGARSVLHTGLANFGAILHPTITLLNAERIERGDSLRLLYRGRHAPRRRRAGRCRWRAPCALPAPTAWRHAPCQTGSRRPMVTTPTRMLAAVGGNPAYVGIKAPATLEHRYLLEDVPTGLIPLIELGDAAGLAVPTLRSLARAARVSAGWQAVAAAAHPRRARAARLGPRPSAASSSAVSFRPKVVRPARSAFFMRCRTQQGLSALDASGGWRMKDDLIVGAAIGDCVHVAGVVNFLNLAEQLGYETVCLGPGGFGGRSCWTKWPPWTLPWWPWATALTPENCRNLLSELAAKVAARGETERAWLFGGTEPCVAVARELDLFQMTFASGTSKQAVVAYLRGEQAQAAGTPGTPPPQTLVDTDSLEGALSAASPSLRPADRGRNPGRRCRHRRPSASMSSRLAPIKTPRNTSSAPTEMDPGAHGAGGVPVRTEADLAAIYAHCRLGNHPLMRCYSGTRDTMQWAPMLARTINNAWCAIPLFWYTQLDGRSPRPLREAIPETQALMRWHAERGIPVEMNESHHWSLRDAPDVVAVVAAYLAAYNARAAGVQDYVQQLMFNNPPNTSPVMDLGKDARQARNSSEGAPERATFQAVWPRDTRRPDLLSAGPKCGLRPSGGYRHLANATEAAHRPHRRSTRRRITRRPPPS